MSRAVAVYHGDFGRAGLYQLNRPIVTHAHREGHLVFHVAGRPARMGVGETSCECSADIALGVNPWQPHSYAPPDYRGMVTEWIAQNQDRRAESDDTLVLSRS